jgi:hypothetical protein
MCDCDWPIMATDIVRIARKQHHCCECYELIHKGEHYYFHKLLFDGAWQSYKMCLRCQELFRLVEKEIHPDCVCFTGLREAFLGLRTPVNLGGIVPIAWLRTARRHNLYRNKYYGERVWA